MLINPIHTSPSLQIILNNRFKNDSGEDCLVSVDGVDFMIEEPFPYTKDVSNIWYSQKFHGPGLRYEVGVGIKEGDIVWLQGPFPAGQHNDCTLFQDGLANYLDPFERVEADDGYRAADPEKVKSKSGFSHRYSSEEKLDVKNRVRARHETVNKRIKQFASLSSIFRHDLVKHSDFVYASVVLTQICIEMGEPLFQVDYNNMP